MSNLVFPSSLPGFTYEREVEPTFRTTVHQTVSGKKYATSWDATPLYRYHVRANVLRQDTPAPAPYASWNEVTVILKFLTDHRGQFDTFLHNDPIDSVQRRVRLTSDSIVLEEIAPGLWKCEVEMLSEA